MYFILHFICRIKVLFQFLFFQATNEAGFSLVPGLAVPRPFRSYTLTIRNWWTSSKHNKQYYQNKHHNMCRSSIIIQHMEDFITSYTTNLLTLSTDGLVIYFGRNWMDLKRNARFHYNIYHQVSHHDEDGVNRLLLTSLDNSNWCLESLHW